MRIAQITDCHIRPEGMLIYGAIDTAAYLARAVEAVNALDPPPDLVLLTGDLVDAGSPAEYARLIAILRPLRAPYFVIPGNHDTREGLRAAFADHSYLASGNGFINYALEAYPIRLIGLDSIVPGEVWGRLCPVRLAWLDRALAAAPALPTLIFIHHPPFPVGIAHMDEHPFEGALELAALIRRHPNVERLIAGHVHRAIQLRWAGTVASTCPSTAHHFALDFRPDALIAYTLEPPAFQLHCWIPGTGIVTHTAAIGDYPRHRLDGT